MPRKAWALTKDAISGYFADEAMTRGAAIACYTMFSIAPLLVVAIAIAGLFFSDEAVRGAVEGQLRALVGRDGAEAVQGMIRGARGQQEQGGGFGPLVGLLILLVTASGVFAELQAALNAIWKATPKGLSLSYLVKARALSIGLVAATGFLLLVSLVASAVLAAFGEWLSETFPAAGHLLRVLNFLVSFGLTAALFAAIFKVLPDRWLSWRDVAFGAVVTAVLFTLGKSLIGWYIGGSNLAASYGAAGTLVVVLLWVYYSAQIFMLGAEFTRAWAGLDGTAHPAPVGSGAAVENAPRADARREKV